MDIDDYIEIFKAQSNSDGKTLANNTYKTMATNLRRILKVFKISNIDDLGEAIGKDNDYLSNINRLINHIKDEYSLNTTIQTILAIQKYLELYSMGLEPDDIDEGLKINLIAKYLKQLSKYLKICCDRNQQIINENKLTLKERDNWIDYTSMVQQFTNYIKTTEEPNTEGDKFYFHRNNLILGFFVLIPPTRITNYEKMYFKSDVLSYQQKLPTDRNFILKEDYEGEANYYLVFNQYKTSKHLGSVYKKIGNSSTEILLKTLITKYLDSRENIAPYSCELFLINIYCSPITQPKYTDILKQTSKKIFNKELSCDLLRKIFITNYMKKAHSISENTEVAKFMGQTYNATMMEKYRKIDTPEEGKSQISSSIIIGFD